MNEYNQLIKITDILGRKSNNINKRSPLLYMYNNGLIEKKYETPVGQYALSEIVNGKKLNYHLITLVKICSVLNIKPHSIVETDLLNLQLEKQ